MTGIGLIETFSPLRGFIRAVSAAKAAASNQQNPNDDVTDSWKTWLWRTIITVACFILIAACFYAEENARGLHAWQKCERDLAARGESLDWNQYVPAPVPDDQNFYKAPMMAEWFIRNTNSIASSSAYALPAANPETTANIITEITASNYLAWSATFEPGFDLMRDALKRPLARIDGDYTRPFNQPIPNFVSHRIVAQTLAHRAKCYLLLGEPDKALADLTLMHQLDLTIVKDGKPNTLVTSMIHTAISGLYADAVACGLESRSWREPELAALQKQLAEINLLRDVAYSFQAGRASTCFMLDSLSPDQLMRVINGSTRQVSDLGWWLMPGGWIQQNKTVIATLEGKIIESIDVTNNTISPFKAQIAGQSTEQAFRRATPWNFLAAMCVPNFTKATETMARNQTWVDQAQIVCALERYRLAHGKYPDQPAALAPQFIEKMPHDIIGGRPMNYSCTDGENFRLYSIGWNEADDGGITAHTSDGKEDRESGDWVWHYPAF